MADLAEPLVDPVGNPAPGAGGRKLWADRLRHFAQTGLTITDFCKAEDIRTQTFYLRRAKLAKLHTPSQPIPLRPDKPAFLLISLQQ